ncbi:hypothetical protein OMAG_000712 [Candidatus Omnitrophus magneticus]|uniref:Uncharacterized protein n=1 Tax=Candidatus Omnitrophus magneticus TaxID=1609969 RepID=A0A0F0CTR1_9BACT|nr:hypothetical protein OMAG_000712 [Candidatus Omnitrophus magneticus]
MMLKIFQIKLNFTNQTPFTLQKSIFSLPLTTLTLPGKFKESPFCAE